MNIRIHSMKGLGDNIYQRPYVRELSRKGTLYIDTPWPELYKDLDVKFIKPNTTLRTQKKNYSKFENSFWSDEIKPDRSVSLTYQKSNNIQEALAKNAGTEVLDMDLPEFNAWFKSGRPIAIIRPVTERKEWHNRSRNPNPEYIEKAARKLSETHCVVSIADIDNVNEWRIGDEIHADYKYEHGELDVSWLMYLIKSADIIVGGPGWIVPAAMATKGKALIIAGGNGADNNPDRLSKDYQNITWAIPDNFCMCNQFNHNCDKTISKFDEILEEVCAK